MTDTPRTKAELLALFANNTTHDISPQDLRDFVVSSAPVAAARYADYGNFTIYDNDRSAIKYLPNDSVDPEGWFTDEAAYTSGFLPHPVPQGGLLRLPPGWYDAFIFQSWEIGGHPLAATAAFQCGLVHADDPGPLDDIFGGVLGQQYNVGVVYANAGNTALNDVQTYSPLRIPSKMLDNTPVTTWPVAAVVFLNNQGENLTGSYGQILVRRIGPA